MNTKDASSQVVTSTRPASWGGSHSDPAGGEADLKSHAMAFFMVIMSHIAANSPLTISCRAAQQSWKVPDLPTEKKKKTARNISLHDCMTTLKYWNMEEPASSLQGMSVCATMS
ncbi:hypothetical protein E2C01_017245 [Portunus trituberculatus]|uniref:Uncharacterized protein n=1 Tax=Portunus trituberculatus TaxID=210409 RepID=A0A5B7DSX5_PORTR|nr:hypothetical protein [Portunus trituberculatus]